MGICPNSNMFCTWYGVFWAYLKLKTALKVVIGTEWSFKRSTDSPQRRLILFCRLWARWQTRRRVFRTCSTAPSRSSLRSVLVSIATTQLNQNIFTIFNRPSHLIGQCFVTLFDTTEPNYFHYFQASPPPRPSLSPNYLFWNHHHCHLWKPGVRSRPDPHHVCALFRWIQVRWDKIEEQI